MSEVLKNMKVINSQGLIKLSWNIEGGRGDCWSFHNDFYTLFSHRKGARSQENSQCYTLLFKKGSRDNPRNYRPVRKLLEKILRDRIYSL